MSSEKKLQYIVAIIEAILAVHLQTVTYTGRLISYLVSKFAVFISNYQWKKMFNAITYQGRTDQCIIVAIEAANDFASSKGTTKKT